MWDSLIICGLKQMRRLSGFKAELAQNLPLLCIQIRQNVGASVGSEVIEKLGLTGMQLAT
jgi:hypothetical protein